MPDLFHATRDELNRLIRDQAETIADQERRLAAQAAELEQLRTVIAELTVRLGALEQAGREAGGSGAPKGMPGLKPTPVPAGDTPPRRRRAKGAGRSRMTPSARVVHALRSCPRCGAPLSGGSPKRSREVIELPPPRIVVTEHLYLERRCPDCGKRCVPPPELDQLVSGQRRLGHGLSSLLAVLREEARLPIATIQQLLVSLTGLQLSAGAITETVAAVADRGHPQVAAIAAQVRASPVVHVDETGWREGGRNGYVWTLSTPRHRYFVRGSRARSVLTELLGESFAGVLVSNFYTAYTGYEGLHQYCWAHLLRDLAELTLQHPDDAGVQGWVRAVQEVFAHAQTGARAAPAERERVRQRVEADLTALCTPWLAPKGAQTTLCQRILTHLPSLFVFVTEPAVPPTNNAAERSLRPLVVARKISGGTRSARGTATRLTLASLFGTWRAQGLNPYDACLDLLRSPQL